MSIPYKMLPTGFDSWYVKLYRELCQLLESPLKFELGWVASEKKLIIHTDRVDDATLAEVAALVATLVPAGVTIDQYNHHIGVSWRNINRYAECKTLEQMNEVAQSYGFASYKEDLTSDGWWVYPLDNFIGSLGGFFGSYNSGTAELRGVDLRLPLFSNVGASALANCKNLEYARLYAPHVWTNNQSFFQNDVKLTHVDAYVPGIYRIDAWCAGCTSLSHFRFLVPLQEGALAGGGYAARIWDGCVLDVASVQNIAENLPTMPSLTTTTIGINEAFQSDEAMLEALELLKSKNWDIELQTNQSPT